MWVLAAIASFLFPGAGQALARDLRRTALWVIAGLVPIVLVLWLPQAMLVAIAVRVVAAVDAWIVVRRAAPDNRYFGWAAGVAVGTGFALLVLRLFVLEWFVPQSSSMAPTLSIGDYVFIDKLTPRFVAYERGEIVVFEHPAIEARYLKRIAAVGGDTVAVREGVLYVNGVAQAQTRIGGAKYWDGDVERDVWNLREVEAYREDLGGHVHTIFRDYRLPSEKYVMSDYPAPESSGETACARTTAPDQPRMEPTADGTACVVPRGSYFVLGDNRDNSNDSRSWGAVPAKNLLGRAIGNWWSSNDRTGIEWSRIGRVE